MKSLYLEEFNEEFKDLIKHQEIKAAAPRLIYNGIKYINNSSNEVDGSLILANERLNFIKQILMLIQQVSPRVFLDIFPLKARQGLVEVEFYSYEESLSYIEEYGLNQLIKDPIEFLWTYGNKSTNEFINSINSTILNLLRLRDGDSDSSNNFIEGIKKDIKVGQSEFHVSLEGKAYLIDDKGRSVELKRQFPGYLREVRRPENE